MRALAFTIGASALASCTVAYPLDYLKAGGPVPAEASIPTDAGAAGDGGVSEAGSARGCGTITPQPSFCVDFDEQGSSSVSDPIRGYANGQTVVLRAPDIDPGGASAFSLDAWSAPRALAFTTPAAGTSSVHAEIETPSIDVDGHARGEAMVKMAQPSAGMQYHELMTFEASTGLKVFVSVEDGAPRLSIAHGSGDAGDATTFDNAVFPTDRWARVGVTIDTEPPVVIARMSVDGAQIGSVAVNAPSITGTLKLTFGLVSEAGSGGGSVLFDDVQLDRPH